MKTLSCGFTVQQRKKSLTAFVLPAFVPKLRTSKLPDVSQLWGDAAHEQEVLLRQLVQAEQDVAESKALVAIQQRLIVESERNDCHDTAETLRRLGAFLVLQRSREEDRARILDELYDVRFGSRI